ncbi:ectoine/hydroxyectoine ABC transporter substrate-binding protein EhuB [Actinomarinicola tropica]|uniref:Ectoine/hydroxyectoine ABC transporter substrate-binding protein EhuB n=1 Tax=Actinomarinicola tropica TaxID=2789776 RepID=A0A5Q2RJC0_9ACTN|nr:ectoine/hydroxyectoine ABC transporter substrate-binding protein EhuB [Actinomarinicola tropica]QGG94486.1 ectoine/hydroxyectoine ABC transporter substrate-binding protein EhuB [Actinomarinicola tropica]
MTPSRHRRPTILWRVLALLAAFTLIAAACGDDDGDDGGDDGAASNGGSESSGEGGDLLAELQESGSITIGVANEVPFGFVGEDGEPTGIAPDVAREVLAELGIEEIEVDVVEFGNLIGGLQAGQFDLIAAGMYITPERAEQILFSDPDYCVAEGLAVPEGNPEGVVDYSSFVDNSDLTLAVATGTVEVGYAEDAGIPDDQIQEFADIDGMYSALEAGEVDAVSGTAATVQRQVAVRSGMEAVEPFFPVDENGEEVLPCGAYGFRNENQAFRDAFNDVLNEMRESGRTIEIITEYEDFSEADVEKANELTLEDFLD